MRKTVLGVIGIATLLGASVGNPAWAAGTTPRGASCRQLAAVVEREFYVCAQVYAADTCFEDMVLSRRPQVACSEWTNVCEQTCAAASLPTRTCLSACGG